MLYVADVEGERSRRALATTRAVVAGYPEDDVELVVVDVLEDDAAARRVEVVATPTLVRELPAPARRVIGDLGDVSLLHRALGIDELRDGAVQAVREPEATA